MVDFLKANPFISMEEYLWGLSVPMIRIISTDFTHIEYNNEENKNKSVKKVIDGNNLNSDLGIPIFN